MKKTRRVIMSLLLVLSLAVAMLATPVANASRPSQAEIDEGSSKMPAYQRDSMKKFEDDKGTFSIDWNAASITKMAGLSDELTPQYNNIDSSIDRVYNESINALNGTKANEEYKDVDLSPYYDSLNEVKKSVDTSKDYMTKLSSATSADERKAIAKGYNGADILASYTDLIEKSNLYFNLYGFLANQDDINTAQNLIINEYIRTVNLIILSEAAKADKTIGSESSNATQNSTANTTDNKGANSTADNNKAASNSTKEADVSNDNKDNKDNNADKATNSTVSTEANNVTPTQADNTPDSVKLSSSTIKKCEEFNKFIEGCYSEKPELINKTEEVNNQEVPLISDEEANKKICHGGIAEEDKMVDLDEQHKDSPDNANNEYTVDRVLDNSNILTSTAYKSAVHTKKGSAPSSENSTSDTKTASSLFDLSEVKADGWDDHDDINQYVKGLNYNSHDVLYSKGKGVSIAKPKEAQGDENSFKVITRTKKSVENGSADISAISGNSVDVYPGALLQANTKLMDGQPVPVNTTDRSDVQLTVNLPNIGGNGTVTCQPTYSDTKRAIDDVVYNWYYNSDRPQNTKANYDLKYSMISSEDQAKADFGVDLGSLLKIDFNKIQNNEKQVMVMAYKQIYYNVSIPAYPTGDPAAAFGSYTSIDEVKKAFDANNPPVYIRNVDYGRMIYLKMETSSNSSEVEAALKAAIKGVDVSGNTTYKNILANTQFNVLVIGGNTEHAGEFVSVESLDEVKDIINNDAALSEKNIGTFQPISYTTTFLKDNNQATISRTSEYVETSVEEHKKADVTIHQEAGFSCKEIYFATRKIEGFDDKGKPIYSNDTVRQYSETMLPCCKTRKFSIPANAAEYQFAYDIFWGSNWPFSGYLNRNNKDAMYKNIDITVHGTCRNGHCRVNVDGVQIRDE